MLSLFRGSGLFRPRVLLTQSLSSRLVKMKLDSVKFEAIITPELRTLSEMFTRHGYELRIAGGAVR